MYTSSQLKRHYQPENAFTRSQAILEQFLHGTPVTTSFINMVTNVQKQLNRHTK